MQLSLAILTLSLTKTSFQFDQSLKQNLTLSLLNGYQSIIRPNETVTITILFFLRQILSIDEKNQVMTSNVYFYQSWSDERLKWDNSSGSTYHGINTILVPAKRLWAPDNYIVNSLDTNGYLSLKDDSLASIANGGSILINVPIPTLKTRCNIDTKKFPFDSQSCRIDFTSWMHQNNQINYRFQSGLDTAQYEQNSIWSLESTKNGFEKDTGRWSMENYFYGQNNYFPKLFIQINLRRKPLYFMINGVFPCLVLNVVTIVSYFLPFNIQITLSMTCFLTFSVNAVRISSDIPIQSDYLPVITLYFLFSIVYTLTSILWFSTLNYFTQYNYLPNLILKLLNKLKRNDVEDLSQKHLTSQLALLDRIVFWTFLVLMVVSEFFIWMSIYF